MTNIVNLKKSAIPKKEWIPLHNRVAEKVTADPKPIPAVLSPKVTQSQLSEVKPATQQKSSLTWNSKIQNSTYGHRILWLLGMVLTIAIVLVKFNGSLLLVVLIGIASTIILLTRLQPAQDSTIEIHNAGIKIGENTHYWKDIHSFWVEYNPGGIKELSVQMRKPYLPRLTIPLAETDPIVVRDALILYVPEEEHELSVIDAFLKQK